MKFSVLMSVYKAEKPKYLKKSLESIINQTLLPDEVVLVIDGRLTPSLYRVIEEFQREYKILKTYTFENNVMLGRALAQGLNLCSNEIVARMDTDDIALPHRFERQYYYLMNNINISVVGCAIEEFNDQNTLNYKKYMPNNMREIRRYIKYRNPFNHMTVMFRKSDVLRVGNYRHFPLLEDYDLWNRMLAKGYVFANIDDILVKVRANDDRYAKRGGIQYFKQFTKLRVMQYQLKILNKFEFVKSLFGTMVMTLVPNRGREIAYRFLLRK